MLFAPEENRSWQLENRRGSLPRKLRHLRPQGQAGISLPEILIGSAITIIVTAIAFRTVLGMTGQLRHHSTKSVLNELHNEARLLVDNNRRVIEALGTIPVNLKECMNAMGSNCESFASSTAQNFEPSNLTTLLNASFHADGSLCNSDCVFTRKVTYQHVCDTPQRCPRIEVGIEVVQLRAIGDFPIAKPRRSSRSLAGRLLFTRGEVDLSCAQTGSLTGLDFVSLRGICEEIQPEFNCSNLDNLNRAGRNATLEACRPLAQTSALCSRGLAASGLSNSQQACSTSQDPATGSGSTVNVQPPLDCETATGGAACYQRCYQDVDVDFAYVQNGDCTPCFGKCPGCGLVSSTQERCVITAFPESTFNITNLDEAAASADHTGINWVHNGPPPPSPEFSERRLYGDLVKQIQQSGNCGLDLRSGFGIDTRRWRWRFRRNTPECLALDPLPPRGCFYTISHTVQYRYESALCGSPNPQDDEFNAQPDLFDISTGESQCDPGYKEILLTSHGPYADCSGTLRLDRRSRVIQNCVYGAPGARPGAVQPGRCYPFSMGSS